MSRGFWLLRLALGTFLLATAGLKIHGLASDPLSEDLPLLSPRLLTATIEVEILLSLWLLSGWSARASWAGALGFFGILGGLSLYLALVGQRSCGCFGRVEVSPWLTFVLDTVVILALAICRPTNALGMPLATWLTGLGKVGLGAAVFLMLIAGGLLLVSDKPLKALAHLRGESIGVEPVVAEAGEAVGGEQRDVTVRLTNHSDRPVRVLGGTNDCSCVATGDLPLVLPPKGTSSIAVRVTFQGSSGRFWRHFTLYTDDDLQPVLTVRFAGRVIEPASDVHKEGTAGR